MPVLDTVFRHRHDVAERRLSICRECPHFVERTTKCEKCGCFMKAKALFMSSECPIGKWGKE